eukprot:CAMPEP_0198494634 /NCGR_PEP_ID=MMETSP1462-20131121/4738_1 /TAXON_ID=1333877 /ORGANISM="Brandtodinium nutriculum, Strain RCC3387" /LENGTH=240 /DNA_ID=CAMNT_0044223375 /DNA_START=233 /DNA_END=953 /DNA_ORIENTATION=-
MGLVQVAALCVDVPHDRIAIRADLYVRRPDIAECFRGLDDPPQCLVQVSEFRKHIRHHDFADHRTQRRRHGEGVHQHAEIRHAAFGRLALAQGQLHEAHLREDATPPEIADGRVGSDAKRVLEPGQGARQVAVHGKQPSAPLLEHCAFLRFHGCGDLPDGKCLLQMGVSGDRFELEHASEPTCAKIDAASGVRARLDWTIRWYHAWAKRLLRAASPNSAIICATLTTPGTTRWHSLPVSS